MAEIIPFKGIIFNQQRVAGDDVIAPPYDIISSEYRDELYQKSPYNVVRIDFGKEHAGDTDSKNKYSRAANDLSGWLAEGILTRDSNPCFYSYVVDYKMAGEPKTLKGLLAMVKIEELGKGVYPHEATHSKPKSDRLNLMRTCFGNISPIYSLYHSPERIASKILEETQAEVTFSAIDNDGACHKIFRISDEKLITLVKRDIANKAVFIADGHHRYEVAIEYKREMDAKHGANSNNPWNYVLMFLANMADEGITILPTHRIVKGLPSTEAVLSKIKPHFEVVSVYEEDMASKITRLLAKSGRNAFGLYLTASDKWYLLKYKGAGLDNVELPLSELDVVLLHELILKKDLGITEVVYEMDAHVSVAKARNSGFDAVFFLNPTDVGDVEKVALSNLRMPPKSTYFYPKLLTGMVINSFKN
ncbi:MAG: DUF1015 domain-containing protein [Nitrospirae bacterium]|nr:DUF1015 domain-containing protein [Nitrospirota bacterium]